MRLYLDNIICRTNGITAPIIDGNIYVSVGGVWFPSDQWFDMVSADLENWIPKLISFGKGHTDSCELRFMDGPYHIQLHRISHDEVSACCLANNRKVIPETVIDFQEFLSSCAKAIGSVGREIYRMNSLNQYDAYISELGNISKELRLLAGL